MILLLELAVDWKSEIKHWFCFFSFPFHLQGPLSGQGQIRGWCLVVVLFSGPMLGLNVSRTQKLCPAVPSCVQGECRNLGGEVQ